MRIERLPPVSFIQPPPYFASRTQKPVKIAEGPAPRNAAHPGPRAADLVELILGAIARHGIELSQRHGLTLPPGSGSERSAVRVTFAWPSRDRKGGILGFMGGGPMRRA